MTWFIFALLTALAVASQDAWVKKWFSHLTAYEMFVYPLAYALPLTAITLVFVPIPDLDKVFWASFLASIPLNAVPFVLYMKAIKASPLSLTLPYLAFTPVFMIATGYVFLGEMPDHWGILGIAAVCIGSYVLNIQSGQRSVWDPFRAMGRETGSRIMLLVAFIFSFSAVIGKLAILHSSVMFFQMAFFTVLSLILLLMGMRTISVKKICRMPVKGAIAGILLYCHILFHGYAISLAKAAYMISVKRLSILFGVIYGGMVFGEDNIFIRFAGAFLMFLGTALILLKAG
ncbi:MAG TPA: DMT family transporter [Desulfosalsimonadaceae bacterium]|nr:DMT family transporter [Desulfosalsimonadaceae bacterium]